LEAQLASLKAVIVYVLVDTGDTVIIYGLVAIPVTGVEVVPSK
jgi:hypothetical protein